MNHHTTPDGSTAVKITFTAPTEIAARAVVSILHRSKYAANGSITAVDVASGCDITDMVSPRTDQPVRPRRSLGVGTTTANPDPNTTGHGNRYAFPEALEN